MEFYHEPIMLNEIVAGLNLGRILNGKDIIEFPNTTAIGALANYVSHGSTGEFQPMNVNFGIIDSDGIRERKKREKNAKISKRALEILEKTVESI